MSNITTLSPQITNERRAMTTNAQSLRKSVPVRDIDIISEGILSYQGRYVEMTPKAFTQLMRLIGMSKQFAN
jgi:chemotaxis receptor (MCP) glutamine deamidase CheD